MLSVCIPLFNIPLSSSSFDAAPVNPAVEGEDLSYYMEPLSNVVITGDQVKQEFISASIPWHEYILIIYMAGAITMSILFFIKLLNVFRIIRKGTRMYIENNRPVVISEGNFSISSFFNYLIWNKETDIETEEGKKILKHELAHIRQLHSYDVILMEILKIIFWFNPAAYFLQKSLREVHEYCADEEVLQGEANDTPYCNLIMKESLKNLNISLPNSFNQSNLKRRLTMITKSKSGAFKKAKLILALPIIGAMLLAFSCSKYVADIMETNYYPKHADSTIVKVSLWDTQNLYSGTTDRYMQKLMLVLIHHGYTINDIPLDKADHSPITFGRMSIDGVVERGSIKKRDGSPIRRDDPLFSLDEVACLYTYIRKRREESVNAHWLTQNRMPEFSADKDPYAWATYIWKNISWPESAEQKKIEGYISVQLKIKTDGGIISADVDVQTSDEQEKIKLKAEVLRVINNMPLFKPALEDGHTIDYLTLPVRVNFSMADPNIWGKIKVYKYYQ